MKPQELKGTSSAKYFISNRQRLVLLGIAGLLMGGLLFFPFLTTYYLLFFFNIVFIILVLSKFLLLLFSILAKQKEADGIYEYELPTYTILVPLFKEERIIPTIVKNLNSLDYDKNKLQILLIVESSDKMTQEAIASLTLPPTFEVIEVPYSFPQTKPKALNYAFQFVTGEYVTVYDAEDQPDKMQLKKALYCLQHQQNIAVQCKLTFFNNKESILARLFTIEYRLLFQHFLPTLCRFNLPITLGGTSNHFRKQDLQNINLWDSYNVTEDADLGIRIAKGGGKIAIVNSWTWEEATTCFMPWLLQRTRWIKGFIQTYFIHMRFPLELYKQLGWKGFLCVQLFVGLPNFILTTVAFLFILTNILLMNDNFVQMYDSSILPDFTWFTLGLGIITTQISALIAMRKTDFMNLLTCLSMPCYYLLHIIAALCAVKELITHPHRWNKTQHAVSSYRKFRK